ncbi:hypothetical protein [Agromyces humi]|uniref:hypothetical protein n=1 Tax=Agromyces humi TaxID=1766800 RepID=UPI00135BD73A|nr:hypothetical protein [Agromyces humi]
MLSAELANVFITAIEGENHEHGLLNPDAIMRIANAARDLLDEHDGDLFTREFAVSVASAAGPTYLTRDDPDLTSSPLQEKEAERIAKAANAGLEQERFAPVYRLRTGWKPLPKKPDAA